LSQEFGKVEEWCYVTKRKAIEKQQCETLFVDLLWLWWFSR